MATPTPNYGYELPAVGGDFEIWGGFLVGNWSQIDADLKALQDALDIVETAAAAASTNADTRVAKIGDTMTGPLALPATEPTNVAHATKKSYVDNGELAQASR